MTTRLICIVLEWSVKKVILETRVLTYFIVFVCPVLLEPTFGCTWQLVLSVSSAPDRWAQLDKENQRNEPAVLDTWKGSALFQQSVDAGLDTDISGWVHPEQQGKLITSTARVGMTCSFKYNKVNAVYLMSSSAAEFTSRRAFLCHFCLNYTVCSCFCCWDIHVRKTITW